MRRSPVPHAVLPALGRTLVAVALCAGIVGLGTQLGGTAAAHPMTTPKPAPAHALVAVRELRAELNLLDHRTARLATIRHKAEVRASRARRARLEAMRPKWATPTWQSLTSPFGYRWGGFHPGVDFTGATGTPVFAAGDGWIVTPVGTAGYGNVIAIAHPDGATTWYAHLSRIIVGSGHVQAGQLIGLVGATGHVTGPHLHFEVRYHNTPVDPVPWLRGHGVRV